MARTNNKPTEYRQFEKLAKGLMGVPKKSLDKKVQRYEANKRQRKTK
jgi:hypothetical protein